MSENRTVKGPNELKRNYIISEQIAKIQKDTQELIERTIEGHPASVNVVKVSANRLIIEVDLNEFNLDHNRTQQDPTDDGSKNSRSPNDHSLDKSTKDDSSTHQTLDDQSNAENVDSDGKPILKGILKYTNSWKKRTLSESSFDNSSPFTDHEDDEHNFSLSLSCSDLDCYSGDKACKKVTFNKQISSKLFSKNQRTIEARPKKKGKKKHTNKKAKGDDLKTIVPKKLSANRFENAKNEAKSKSTDAADKCEDISIDELSFLVCSSDSDASNLVGVDDSGNNADVSGNLTNNMFTNGLENSIENDEDTLSEQKIDHNTLGKENWSEVKSSKKVKKNRKRNDSGSNDSTNSGDREQSCDDQASKQMSLAIKNALEIQVN